MLRHQTNDRLFLRTNRQQASPVCFEHLSHERQRAYLQRAATRKANTARERWRTYQRLQSRADAGTVAQLDADLALDAHRDAEDAALKAFQRLERHHNER